MGCTYHDSLWVLQLQGDTTDSRGFVMVTCSSKQVFHIERITKAQYNEWAEYSGDRWQAEKTEEKSIDKPTTPALQNGWNQHALFPERHERGINTKRQCSTTRPHGRWGKKFEISEKSRQALRFCEARVSFSAEFISLLVADFRWSSGGTRNILIKTPENSNSNGTEKSTHI